MLAISFLQFNTSRGPFTDVRLRRAVNYAVDRRALAAVEDDLSTDSFLPPGLASAPRQHAYPLSPNLARARSLAHGFRGTVVLYACQESPCIATARTLRANLRPLGISLEVRRFRDPFGEALKRADYDLLLAQWFFDYPDPSSGLNLFLAPNGQGFKVPSLPIPARYRQALDRAALLQGKVREDAYRRLAVKIDREVAPFVAYATPVIPEFFSARVGCRVEQPVIAAVDIGALCIKD